MLYHCAEAACEVWVVVWEMLYHCAEAACEVWVVVWEMLYHWLRSFLLFLLPTPLLAKDISGHLVLITGAGSGIGRLLALEFSPLNCRLVLWDVNEEGNRETARLVRDMGAVVKTYRVDVSDRQQVYKAATQVTSEVGAVDILVNNAGIVTGRTFLECPDSMIAKTMAVNTLAHFWTTNASLPAMLSRDHGHVVSIASSAGLLGVTGLADYCSSKFAAVGFDEALRLELQTHGKTGVHTTVVCLYLISTGMFDGCTVRFPWFLNVLEPEEVAREVVRAVLRNQEMLVLPRLLYVSLALKGRDTLQWILPTKCLQVICSYLGVFSLMDRFRGREHDQPQRS
ncbi:hypothetical protein ACOMHN_059151 [Nucella lapillus]